MRSPSRPAPQAPSRPVFRILLLMALWALFAVGTGLAQTPQPSSTMPQPVPTVAEFLASLADNPGDVPSTDLLPPSPKPLSTVCHTKDDCAPGELCCYPCGIPDCNFVCMRVKRCPLIP